MDVQGVGATGGARPVGPAGPTEQAGKPAGTKPIDTEDQLEISQAARMLENASRSPDIRAERIEQIKAAIADGTYESPEKLQAALARLFAEHGLDFDGEALER